MRLVWQIVWKDLLRFRWMLVLWAALIASKLVLGASLLWTSGGASMGHFLQVAFVADALQQLERIGALLLAAVVLEDPVVGNRAFWLTRPISGQRLLCAKFLLMATAFVALPLLVTIPWWLLCGSGGSEIAIAATRTLGFHAPGLLLAWFFSAISEGLPQTIGRAFIGLGCLIVAFLTLHFSWRNWRYPEFELPELSFWSIFAVAAGVLVLYQYSSRRGAHTIWLAALLLVATPGIWLLNPEWAKIFRMDPPDGHTGADATPAVVVADSRSFSLRLTQTSLTLYRAEEEKKDFALANPIVLRFEIDGLAEDEWLVTEFADVHLRWASGFAQKASLYRAKPIGLEEAIRWHDHGHDPLLAPNRGSGQIAGPWQEQDGGGRGMPTSCNYSGWFHTCRIVRMPVPMEIGAAWRGGERMAGCEMVDDELRLLIVRRRAEPARDEDDHRLQAPPAESTYLRLVRPGQDIVYFQRESFRATRIGGVRISWQEVRFLPTELRFGGDLKRSRISLNGAELVQLRLQRGPRVLIEGTVEYIHEVGLETGR